MGSASPRKLLETRELETNFYTFEGVVKALNGVSVLVNQGETYCLVGESGCGKSVTVRSMMRIVQSPGRIVGGKILLFLNDSDRRKGIDILKRSEAYMTSMRGNDISMIFQEASTSLNPVLTIGEQVGESYRFHRMIQMLEETIAAVDEALPGVRFAPARWWKRWSRRLFQKELDRARNDRDFIAAIDASLYELEEADDPDSVRHRERLMRRRDRHRRWHPQIELIRRIPLLRLYRRPLDATIHSHVVRLLERLGVANPARIARSYPHELSGGMQQRVVIAIALACEPTLLIADEPTSNLDVTIQAQIIDLIKRLKDEVISSVLFITHDLGLVAEISDRVTVMYAGDVCETAPVRELFRDPRHPYTKGLLESVPKPVQEGELSTIAGTVPNLIHPPAGCRFHPRCPQAMEICSRRKPVTVECAPGHSVACFLYTDQRTQEGGENGGGDSD